MEKHDFDWAGAMKQNTDFVRAGTITVEEAKVNIWVLNMWGLDCPLPEDLIKDPASEAILAVDSDS